MEEKVKELAEITAVGVIQKVVVVVVVVDVFVVVLAVVVFTNTKVGSRCIAQIPLP